MHSHIRVSTSGQTQTPHMYALLLCVCTTLQVLYGPMHSCVTTYSPCAVCGYELLHSALYFILLDTKKEHALYWQVHRTSLCPPLILVLQACWWQYYFHWRLSYSEILVVLFRVQHYDIWQMEKSLWVEAPVKAACLVHLHSSSCLQ